jgi:hypothetical protein
MTPEDKLYLFRERASIYEHDAGFSTADAEKRAYSEVYGETQTGLFPPSECEPK